MEEKVKEILSGLSLEVLKTIKEYPYLLDEVIYEKQIQEESTIQAVGANPNPNGANWIDTQKMGGR
jgi:hypothetical protein